MIEINLNNVEEVVLSDSRLRSLLPEFQSHFDSWLLGQRVAALRPLASRTKVDLLHVIRPEHLAVISKYLGREVSVRPFDSNVVTNRDCLVDSLCDHLHGLEEYAEICLHRSGDKISLSAWR